MDGPVPQHGKYMVFHHLPTAPKNNKKTVLLRVSRELNTVVLRDRGHPMQGPDASSSYGHAAGNVEFSPGI